MTPSIGFGFCPPTFGDVKTYRKRKCRTRPAKVTLIAPHSNENPAALPFLRAVEKQLESSGIHTETKITRDMMSKGWEFSKKLGLPGDRGNRPPAEFENVIDAICSLEDALLRAKSIVSHIDRHSVVVEIHSLSGINDKEDIMADVYDVWRIGGTKICIVKNERTLRTFNLSDKIEDLERNLGFASWLSKLKGFDLENARRELDSLYRIIKAEKNLLKIIELPSVERFLPRKHPMYQYYYDIEDPQTIVKSGVSEFEVCYYARYFHRTEFCEKDLKAVTSVIQD